MHYHCKPQIKLKLSFFEHIMNISNILPNILLFITILYLPLLCNSACNNGQSLTRLDDIKNGKCDDMGLHCNYFSEWGSQNSLTDKYELYCRLNNICNVSNSCLDIDITLSTDSCNQLSTDGNNALLIYIETNEINALTDSEIYCPLYNQNNYQTNIAILIQINILISMVMIKHLSIYSYSRYLKLDLKCDFRDGSMCIKHSVILCGDYEENTQDTCWIKYDIDNDIRGKTPSKCRDNMFPYYDYNFNTTSRKIEYINTTNINMDAGEVSADMANIYLNKNNAGNRALTANVV
eukprot:833929_1